MPQTGQAPSRRGLFHPFDISVLFSLLFSFGTVISMHLTKDSILNKDAYLQIEWASPGRRPLEVFFNYVWDGWR